MEHKETTPASLLGPLNDVEKKHAPQVLFVAGDPSLLRERGRVSIVGSRAASADGIQRAKKLARLLAERGTVVVSGLAEGIDTAAHTAAIEAGGRTIAVIGTPLDKVYPKKNAGLQDVIMREHLVISQFPSGSVVRPKNFVIRNRTMALVSDVTVIIEATDESGSLHQGWEALRLGRGIFIAKSVVDSDLVSWPEKMLYYGARVLSNESLEELFDFLPPRSEAHVDGAVSF
jgi:DNA processing protein